MKKYSIVSQDKEELPYYGSPTRYWARCKYWYTGWHDCFVSTIKNKGERYLYANYVEEILPTFETSRECENFIETFLKCPTSIYYKKESLHRTYSTRTDDSWFMYHNGHLIVGTISSLKSIIDDWHKPDKPIKTVKEI